MWKKRQYGIRQQVKLDDPFPPDPTIINVWVNSGSGLWTVLNAALFHSLVVRQTHDTLEPLLNELSTSRETTERAHFHFTFLKVRFGPEILLSSTTLAHIPRDLVEVTNESLLFLNTNEISVYFHTGEHTQALKTHMRPARQWVMQMSANRAKNSLCLDAFDAL